MARLFKDAFNNVSHAQTHEAAFVSSSSDYIIIA